MTTRPSFSRIWASDGEKVNPDLDIDHPLYVKDRYTDDGWNYGEKPPSTWMNFLMNNEDVWGLSLAESGVTTWGSDVTYNTKGLTWYQGKMYLASRPSKNKNPSTNPEYWDESACSGNDESGLKDTLGQISDMIQNHIINNDNPHNVTAGQVGGYTKAEINVKVNGVQANLSNHANNKDNPHVVTYAQTGAVAITGGTFTGGVSFKYSGRTKFGSGSNHLRHVSNSISLESKDKQLGIDTNGNPYYHKDKKDYEILHKGNYIKLRNKLEPKFAVPNPDFVMPLNDSIRIWEGFGVSTFTRNSRATYIDKSGVLKMAEVDEPRFEKEGILIEGRSTNLIANSDLPTGLYLGNGATATPKTVTLPTGQSGEAYLVDVSSNDAHALKQYDKFTGKHTYSVWVRSVSGSGKWALRLRSGQPLEIVSIDETWRRFEVTRELDASNQGGSCYLGDGRWSDPNKMTTAYVCMMQLEDLPFASSYIPTNGTPVTRAADRLELPQETTLYKKGMPITISCSVNYIGLNMGRQMVWSQSGGESIYYRFYQSGNNAVLEQATPYDQTMFQYPKRNYSVTVTRDSEGLDSIYTDGAFRVNEKHNLAVKNIDKTVTLGVYNDGNYSLFGHIKNFRIWHQTLTPEQISKL